MVHGGPEKVAAFVDEAATQLALSLKLLNGRRKIGKVDLFLQRQ